MHKVRGIYGFDILLENFWCIAIFSAPFSLLLFLRDLTSSILSLVTGLSFVVRESLLKKQVAVIYCDCFHAFFVRENFFEKDTNKFLEKIFQGGRINEEI